MFTFRWYVLRAIGRFALIVGGKVSRSWMSDRLIDAWQPWKGSIQRISKVILKVGYALRGIER